MVALLLNACDNRVENKTTDGNNNADGNETSPPQPQAKFAVTYAGIYATATGTPPSIDLGSGNDGSTLAKAYTITLNTNSSVAPAGLIITQFKPTFKPKAVS